MSEKNLPIKIVLQRKNDLSGNLPGGKRKFFGKVDEQLKNKIINELEEVYDYYSNVFDNTKDVPVVGKIKMKKEAMAKSHKPNRFCKEMPIIGCEKLDEIYFKVTKEGIKETIKAVQVLPSKDFEANMTAIKNIIPYFNEDKIVDELKNIEVQEFDKVRNNIKIKLFDMLDDYDNQKIEQYVIDKIRKLGLYDKAKFIKYGDKIKLINLSVRSYDDIINLSSINGIKSIDLFSQYYGINYEEIDNSTVFNIPEKNDDVDFIVGIIDGGISKENDFLKDYIYGEEVYVADEYINPSHGTFIASMIQYGDLLNDIDSNNNRRFKFLDVKAIPNSDESFGPVDSINEMDLMEIIEDVVSKYHNEVKVWNLSIGNESKICKGSMSDLGVFCDYIQDRYKVQFFISSGNKNSLPLRRWPSQIIDDSDRIISPADSVRAITVGSIAQKDLVSSLVKANEPSPFSRRGPGANFNIKPDVVDFGGNCDASGRCDGVGMKGLGIYGEVVENIGTSFSTPRVVRKYASICEEMKEDNDLIAKAMLIHSARINSRKFFEKDESNIKYYGFGMPEDNISDMLLCSESEVTLVFKQSIISGSHLELMDFPFPESLIKNEKYYGEICMTLVYNPPLNENYGQEYCRSNINVGFGPYRYNENGGIDYKSEVPLEKKWEARYEAEQVENGFKWSPVKSYYRKIKNGINIGVGWKLRVDMVARNNENINEQDFVLIVTIKDSSEEHDIYSEVINGLRNNGYITSDLEVKNKVRARN